MGKKLKQKYSLSINKSYLDCVSNWLNISDSEEEKDEFTKDEILKNKKKELEDSIKVENKLISL